MISRGSDIPTDHITATISSLVDGEVIIEGQGSWVEKLEFGDHKIWSINDPYDDWIEI
jgi:hypothetical protein